MARQAVQVQIDSAEMPNDAQIVIRVPQTMADRIKQYSEQLSKTAGVPISTAAATRKLLELGLDAAGLASDGAVKPKRR